MMNNPNQRTAPSCPECGGNFDESPLCTFCHNGVLYAGAGHAFRDSEMQCPRCEEAPLYEIGFRDLAIDVCIACQGAWFDLGELESLLLTTRNEARQGIFSADGTQAGPAPDSMPPAGQAAYIRCPKCAVLMNRYNWEKRSGTVIDYCRTHGLWLDAGEIAQLRSWAATTPEGPPAPAPETKPKPRRPTTRWMDKPSSSWEARTMHNGLLGDLAHLLGALFFGTR